VMAVSQKAQSQKAHIRFSTQILRRLGEELNPSIDQSILELVKNSYDADATTCTVSLSNISEEGGTIQISDNGDGMDNKGIIDGYLVLGKSQKSFDKRTRLGRIPAGSKGLGRLAALRMGNKVLLESVPLSDPGNKFLLDIDWERFDNNSKMVEDVTLEVEKRQVRSNEKGGTTVTIKALKHKVGARDVKKIARGLILLSNPFEDDPTAFKPRLISEEFKDIESLVARRYFDDAEYHLSASIEKNGMAKASVLDYKGNELFKAGHKELRKADKRNTPYVCPASTFDFWIFILNGTTFATRANSIGEVKEWLDEFGGVHVYENGLRVNPYGNPGNDWLDLNLSRARNPEERPSTNTSIGVVRVKDSQGKLVQKTDRSGFIDNDVFHDLKTFCEDALEWLAKKRLEVAERKRRARRNEAATESQNSKEEVDKVIRTLKTNDKAQVQKAFDTYERAQQKVVNALRAEVQLYRTLSTVGITTATFSHESTGNSIKVLEQSINAIERRGKKHLGEKFASLLSDPISTVKGAIKSLAVLGKATLNLLANEKRRITRVEVHPVITEILKTFEPFLLGRDITVAVEFAKGGPYLRYSEAAIESIITNLLNNSITAIEVANPKERKIAIKTEIQEDILLISVNDNGTGINGISLKDIWLPGHTTSPNGTGLGLTIVKDTITDIGGDVRAQKRGYLGGAEFIVELPIIGK